MNSHRYYKPSGGFSFLGIAVGTAVGAAIIAILSGIYAILDHYNPLIYLNLLACVFLGVGVMMATTFANNIGHNRNFLARFGVTVMVTTVAVYFQWVIYLSALSKFEYFLLNPMHMFYVIEKIAETGLWQIKDLRPTGWALYGIWIIEAVVIVGPAYLDLLSAPEPYCEECQNWTTKYGGVTLLGTSNPTELRKALESEDYNCLFDLPNYDGGKIFIQADVHACDNCEELPHYLTLYTVTVTVNEKGEASSSNDTFVEHLMIPPDLRDQIAADFERRTLEAQAAADAEANNTGETSETADTPELTETAKDA